MAQDQHPDVKLIKTAYGANLPVIKDNDPTKTLDAIATFMGAGWNRDRAQQATRELHIN